MHPQRRTCSKSFKAQVIGKALDYSLKRWTALSRYLDDGAVAIDNN